MVDVKMADDQRLEIVDAWQGRLAGTAVREVPGEVTIVLLPPSIEKGSRSVVIVAQNCGSRVTNIEHGNPHVADSLFESPADRIMSH
jgi:hypothetical protein